MKHYWPCLCSFKMMTFVACCVLSTKLFNSPLKVGWYRQTFGTRRVVGLTTQQLFQWSMTFKKYPFPINVLLSSLTLSPIVSFLKARSILWNRPLINLFVLNWVLTRMECLSILSQNWKRYLKYSSGELKIKLGDNTHYILSVVHMTRMAGKKRKKNSSADFASD